MFILAARVSVVSALTWGAIVSWAYKRGYIAILMAFVAHVSEPAIH